MPFVQDAEKQQNRIVRDRGCDGANPTDSSVESGGHRIKDARHGDSSSRFHKNTYLHYPEFANESLYQAADQTAYARAARTILTMTVTMIKRMTEATM